MPVERPRRWSRALRDMRPAGCLFLLGAFLYFPSLGDRRGHPLWGILGGAVMMPFALAAIVVLLPRPRDLRMRAAVALLTGVAVLEALLRIGLR